MTNSYGGGIDRTHVSGEMVAAEARKSKLILEGRLLREQKQHEAAAEHFAQAAEIEMQLSQSCEEAGLRDKSQIHHFSAASCWAHAGNFYEAITSCDHLLSQEDIPDELRVRVEEYVASLRARRDDWYRELVTLESE